MDSFEDGGGNLRLKKLIMDEREHGCLHFFSRIVFIFPLISISRMKFS
jgi:hypothetical protein